MKKIYSIIALGALISGSITAQQLDNTSKIPFQPKAKVVGSVKNQKTTTTTSQGRFDVSYAMPIAHGKTVNTGTVTGQDYGVYVDPIFVDTTVTKSFSSTSVISDCRVGVTFDPKSIIFTLSLSPLLDKTDSYILDTVWIGGSYQRRKNMLDDTLYVEVVWGDTALSTVYGSFNYASAPISGFGAFKTPKYSTVASVNGNKIQLTAPTSNKIVIKHVITKADSTYMADVSDYLPIVINGSTGQLIPANNIVSCAFSFISAGTHTNGAVSWSSSTAANQGTESGWAAIEYAQDQPALTAIADVSDGYDDFGTGKSGSFNITKKGRAGQEAGLFASVARGAFYWGYWLDFSIRYTSTVGINELENNGSALGQNAPNPFDGSSTVTYKLTKDANAVSFIVTDVTGRIVSSEKASSNTGTHTIKLGSYAAGVYYYTLNVDGKTSTKKMIAQ